MQDAERLRMIRDTLNEVMHSYVPNLIRMSDEESEAEFNEVLKQFELWKKKYHLICADLQRRGRFKVDDLVQSTTEGVPVNPSPSKTKKKRKTMTPAEKMLATYEKLGLSKEAAHNAIRKAGLELPS